MGTLPFATEHLPSCLCGAFRVYVMHAPTPPYAVYVRYSWTWNEHKLTRNAGRRAQLLPQFPALCTPDEVVNEDTLQLESGSQSTRRNCGTINRWNPRGKITFITPLAKAILILHAVVITYNYKHILFLILTCFYKFRKQDKKNNNCYSSRTFSSRKNVLLIL